MKLIKQSYKIINQTDFSVVGIKKHIEKCARVSYKSENKITDTSYEKFVNMLESRGHDRPLEFGTVHLRVSATTLDTIQTILLNSKMYNDYWLEYNIINTDGENNCYITTNYRYYLQMCKAIPWLSNYLDEYSNSEHYPERYTVHMILNRGVMDEFRTHVGLSHLAESTRYCSYNKDKFDNEVTFIIPNWVNTKCPNEEQEGPSVPDTKWSTAMLNAEASYMNLLKMGWKPQQAREVLPLGVKSELISCGFKDAWSNFFYRRDAKDAHPMAQEIAVPMHEEFIKLGYCA